MMTDETIVQLRAFTRAILHGDDEHQAWLKEACEAWIARTSIPPPPLKPDELELAATKATHAERRRAAGIVQAESSYWLQHETSNEDVQLISMGAMGATANSLVAILLGDSVERYKEGIEKRGK